MTGPDRVAPTTQSFVARDRDVRLMLYHIRHLKEVDQRRVVIDYTFTVTTSR